MKYRILLLSFLSLFFLKSEKSVCQNNSDYFSGDSVIKRLRATIEYLAGDSLKGREAGTANEILARDYIIKEFKNFGLKPFISDTSYIQPIPVKEGIRNGPLNLLSINNENYTLNYHYYTMAYSANADITADIINVGYGISDSILCYDDYKNLSGVRGKIFLIEISIPGGYSSKSGFVKWISLSKRIDLAVTKGAAGIIFVNNDKLYDFIPTKLVSEIKAKQVPVVFLSKYVPDNILKQSAHLRVMIERQVNNYYYNVAGIIDNKAENTVVIGAHYDHLGYGDFGTLNNDGSHSIHNGADDNASGTAGVIELAGFLGKSLCKNNNYLFIAFSGEEKGLIGSKFFCTSPDFKRLKINYMLNMDMIGHFREDAKLLEAWAVASSPVWDTLLLNTPHSFANLKIIKGIIEDTDYHPFYKQNLPVITFSTGLHKYYHTPDDDVSIINFNSMLPILYYIENIVVRLDSAGKIPCSKISASKNVKAYRYLLSQYSELKQQ